ncbi:hypothetical protein K8T06_18405 [bacterium]|nr:hypothetical protein [bacterium]
MRFSILRRMDFTVPKFNVVAYFLWPSVQGSVTGMIFHGAILDPSMTELVGDVSSIEFGWQ